MMLGPQKFRHLDRYRKISDFCPILHYTVLHVLTANLALKFANKFKIGAAQCETQANIAIVTRVVAIFTNCYYCKVIVPTVYTTTSRIRHHASKTSS